MEVVVSEKSSALKSRGVTKVEVEQAAEASAGSDCPEGAVVVGRIRPAKGGLDLRRRNCPVLVQKRDRFLPATG